jgi:hypothetical protein
MSEARNARLGQRSGEGRGVSTGRGALLGAFGFLRAASEELDGVAVQAISSSSATTLTVSIKYSSVVLLRSIVTALS